MRSTYTAPPRLARFAALGVVLALTASGCASTDDTDPNAAGDDARASLEPISLIYADYAQEASAGAFKAFADKVGELSDGKITFETYFGNSLLGVGDMLEGVRSGVADIGNVLGTSNAEELPVTAWMQGFTAVTSESFPLQAMENAAATIETVLSSEEIAAEMASLDVRVLYSSANDARYGMLCGDKKESLADLEGLVVSTVGATWFDEAEALGMAPTSIPPAEHYEALQRGVLDCVIIPPISTMDYSLWEVAPYYHEFGFSGYNAGRTIMNAERWESLPEVAQDIIWDALPVLAVEKTKHTIASNARLATEGPADHDLEFVKPSADISNALTAFQDESFSSLANSAPTSVADPQAFLEGYVDCVEKWSTRLIDELDVSTDTSDVATMFSSSADVDIAPYEAALVEIYDANRP